MTNRKILSRGATNSPSAAASTASLTLVPPQPAGRARGLLAVLACLTAVGPLAIDMYIPGFPAMSRTLHTSSPAIQLTLTAFLAGVVVGQIVIGPVSDSLGRRGLLIAGCAGFALVALACAFAPGIGALIAARFILGFVGAAGMVLARAVITDLFHGPEVPRHFALLSQIMSVAPVIAPVIGGAILSVSTWRAVFGALCLAGVLLLVAVLVKVPESLPPERRHKGGLVGTFGAMGRLTRNRPFMGCALVLGLASAALFAYISGSSFVFERIHGASPVVYSLIFAVNAIGMLLAGALFSRLSHRVSMNALLTAAVAVCLAGTLAQVLLTMTLGESFAASWICQFVVLWGIGMLLPATMTLGQNLGRAAPGAASALLGGMQFLFGAVASPVVGLFGETSSLPMSLVMLVSAALAALALIVLVRPRAVTPSGPDMVMDS
ncbi:multidrug effflux MFS transporter [Streptomyces sp. NBC_00005]|uniref:multidrug effflux MFS transporter n=1 Tax=Streptomyces sp. NBC_00005 TaxID=2903609 RepID=UPI0032553115